MKIFRIVSICLLVASGCSKKDEEKESKPRFTGEVGTTWETLANTLESGYSLMTYQPAGMTDIYNMYDLTGQRYSPATNTWTNLVAEGPISEAWFQLAPVGTTLYGFLYDTGATWAYDTLTDTWTAKASYAGAGIAEYTMAVADDAGLVYGYVDTGDVIVYDPAADTVTTLATDIPTLSGSGRLYETRVAYDPGTHSLYLGAYWDPELYRFDLVTHVTTELTPIPESQLNDIFCSDRSGHIYAAGASSGTTMFQYDIATDTWAQIPDLPADHGNNGSCLVSDAGFLYVADGDTAFYRLPLY